MRQSFDELGETHIVCQVMHKCHNYHAIIHKLYTWFGKNELNLYLNGAKISSIRGPRPPLNTPMIELRQRRPRHYVS